MPKYTSYEYQSALDRINQQDPQRIISLASNIKAGKEWDPDEIVDIANEEYGRSALGLGSIIDMLSITPDIAQGMFETSPESFPLSGPDVEKPRERNFFGELFGPGGVGAALEGLSAVKGAKMGFKKRGIKGGIAGGIIGGAAPAIASLGVGAATGNVPKEVFTPATLKNIGKNILEDITDPTRVTRRGPETFTELFPGKDRYTNFGTFMEWVSPEPLMEAALGIGMKASAKGAAKVSLPLAKAIQKRMAYDTSAVIDPIVLNEQLESIAKKIGTDEGAFEKGLDTFQPAAGAELHGLKGSTRGFINNYTEDVVRYIESIAGVGKDKNFLMDSLFDPAVNGVTLSTAKRGQATGWVYRKGKVSTTVDPLTKEKVIAGDPITIGGQFKYDEAEKIYQDELLELLDAADIGIFKPYAKGSRRRELRDYFFKGSKKSQEKSERVVAAMQSDVPFKLSLKNVHERKLAEFLKKSFGDRWAEMNAVRKQTGKKPIAFRANYFPHMFGIDRLDEIFNGLLNMSDEMSSSFSRTFNNIGTGADAKKRYWVSTNMPWFGNALPRKSGRLDYSKDIWEVATKYNRGANKVIYNAIPATIIRQRVEKLAKVGKLTPSQKEYFNKWIDTSLLGKADNLEKWVYENVPYGLTKTVQNMGTRLARNILIGSSSFVFNNIASLAQVAAATGVRNTFGATTGATKELIAKKFNIAYKGNEALLQGATFSGSNLGQGFAEEFSKVYKNRQFTGYEHVGRNSLRAGSLTNIMSHVVDAADQFNVAVSFNSAYMSAVKRGVPHEQAVKFADNMAFKTQAVYSDVFKPAFLRNSLTGVVMPFQTWVNNLFQFIKKDVVGGKLAGQGMGFGGRRPEDFFEELSHADRIGVAVKFAGSAVAINGVFNAMGLKSPYELSSMVPGLEPMINAFGSGSGYGRTNSLFIAGPITDIIQGLGVLAMGMNDERDMKDMINDKEIREGVRSVANFAFRGGGTQYTRWAETVYDKLMQGFTPVSTGKRGYAEAR